MTIDETVQIMDILKIAYPAFYSKKTENEMVNAARLWHEMLSDCDTVAVAVAVKSHISTSTDKFPPTIGEIRAGIAKITSPAETSEMEAWNVVKKALANSNYGAETEFEKFPPAIQKVVGSPNVLREWAKQKSETLDSVIGSNFMRSYKSVSKSVQEHYALPQSVKSVIDNLADKYTIETPKARLTE